MNYLYLDVELITSISNTAYRIRELYQKVKPPIVWAGGKGCQVLLVATISAFSLGVIAADKWAWLAPRLIAAYRAFRDYQDTQSEQFALQDEFPPDPTDPMEGKDPWESDVPQLTSYLWLSSNVGED